VVDAHDVVHVYWRGTDGLLWGTSQTGGVWAIPQRRTSGPLGSAPTAVARPGGGEDVFWMGTDKKHLLYELHDTGRPTTASSLPRAGSLASAPAALIDLDGEENVFWRGTDGILWELLDARDPMLPATSPNSGHLGSAPFALVHPDGHEDVFWRGTGRRHQLYEMVKNAQGWNGAGPVLGSGAVGSQPSAVLAR
jgi:hypothetical protein